MLLWRYSSYDMSTYTHTTSMDAVSQLNLTDLCVRVSVYEKILSFECVPCSFGVYSPLINSTCILSPVGSFVPHMAMSHHIQRPENFASTISGSAFCVPCPRNIFANLQKTICLSSVALIEEMPTIYICNINIYSASPSKSGNTRWLDEERFYKNARLPGHGEIT